jgi:glycine amidinotransferase
MHDQKTVINSWNEWDPLKHVIVGRPDGTMLQAPEPAMVRAAPEHGFPEGTWGPIPEEIVAKANEQMDNFVKLLERRGIRVDRPTPLDFSQKVQTPDWEQESMFGCMPPRDVLLPMGNEILEATMSFRSRWYEYLCYRPLLERYFLEDPNFVWSSAPKPRLTEETYVQDYWRKFNHEWSDEEKERRMRAHDWVITDVEPLFDAADVLRFGRDIIVQRSAVTNKPGIDWLRRHFEPKGIRVHEVAFGGDYYPWHIDATVVAPRPGLLLQNPDRMPLTPEFHQLFEMNDWEVVLTAKPSRDEQVPFCFCSLWLSNNVLSLDPNTVCVESGEVKFMDQLDKLGLEVVPVDFIEVSPFGGGLHCATVDIFREGDCEDYFPKQILGY